MNRYALNYLLPVLLAIVFLQAGAEEEMGSHNKTTATGSRYIFPHTYGRADERLELREKALDEQTREFLRPYLKPGMHCLELGPGRGSISEWMAEQVGSEGSIHAIDNDPAFNVESESNIRLIVDDITSYEFPNDSYHLIFARDVMQHLTGIDHEQLVVRLVKALKPDGVLIFEGAASWGEQRHFQGYEGYPEVIELQKKLMKAFRPFMDFDLPDHHPFHFRKAGLVNIKAKREETYLSGGSSFMKMLALSVQQVVDSGDIMTIEEEEQQAYQDLLRLFHDPDFFSWSQVRVWVSGQKKPEEGKDEL